MHSNSSTGGISRVRQWRQPRLDTAIAKSFNITHLHPGTYHKRRDNCNMFSCNKLCFWMCNFHWLSVDTPVKTADFHKPRGLYEYSGNLKYCSVSGFYQAWDVNIIAIAGGVNCPHCIPVFYKASSWRMFIIDPECYGCGYFTVLQQCISFSMRCNFSQISVDCLAKIWSWHCIQISVM
jgi:hypothetical protein